MKKQTILKFSTSQKIEKLEGGQEQSLKVGHLVLKPVLNELEYLWVAHTLNTLDTTKINISKPALSRYQNYVEDGIGATVFFDNIGHSYDIDLGLQICRQLNENLKNVKEPPLLFENLNNPWKQAHSLAWNEKNVIANLPKEILYLISIRKPLDYPKQLIHCDLTGNILVDKNGSTCIIDFTPAFFPKEYAEAIMIVDYIIWHNAPLNIINKIDLPSTIKYQMILRALLFRISVSLFMYPENPNLKFNEELKYYQKLFLFFKSNNIT